MTWTPARMAAVSALAACGASALIAWIVWPEPTPAPATAQPLPPATNEKPAPVEVKVVLAYPKDSRPGQSLPADVRADPAQQIVATGRLEAERRPYTLTAVIDTDHGGGQVYATPEARPWLGFPQTGGASLAYGYKVGTPVIRLAAHHDFVRLGALHAGVSATLDTDGDWFAGLGAGYTW